MQHAVCNKGQTQKLEDVSADQAVAADDLARAVLLVLLVLQPLDEALLPRADNCPWGVQRRLSVAHGPAHETEDDLAK